MEQAELLAPAGDWDCVRAAVENGADAIYFGLETGFNARARAKNFSQEDLPRVMEFLHERGVRGYVTVNTLAFPSELPALEQVLREIALAGTDAVLVQDIGVVRLIRAVCEQLPIHASTQMTMTSGECLAAAEELGVERVVLARELSIHEISDIRDKTTLALEAFVHGALCVAYSGQCLTSESLGGRSANRGQCAQACRLPYQITCDGEDVELGDVQYLLSPQDLAAYDLIPQMLDAGVSCFKIEGRLKTPEYVANITHYYRQALDAALQGRQIQFGDDQVRDMELSFSRGFSPGWLNGCDHKMLVPGTSSSKRGVLLGEVVRVEGQRVVVELAAPVARGDGIVFEGDRFRGEEQGGRVFEVFQGRRQAGRSVAQGQVGLSFDRRAIDLDQLTVGQQIWKTDDPRLTQRLRKTFTGPDARRRVPLDLRVHASVDDCLTVTGRALNGATCRVTTEEPLQPARKHPLTVEGLRQQLGRLGGTVYELRELEAEIEGQPIVPHSVMGTVRRQIVDQLAESLDARPQREISPPGALERLRAPRAPNAPVAQPADQADSTLYVLCRSLNQIQSACDAGAKWLYAEFQDVREYREAVQTAHGAGARIWLATTRIQKPDEVGLFRALEKHGADGFLVRNLAGLLHFTALGAEVVADFSLNAANDLSVDHLYSRGAARVTVSYDLNRDQLMDLVQAADGRQLEVVVHQHVPMFHMEHCVFCAVLSPGTNKTNCGRPCDLHQVTLRDRVGMEHPLVADVGCRNTLYNAVPQSAAEVVPLLQEHQVRTFRVELLEDDANQVRRVIDLYGRLLSGEVQGKQVWTGLQAMNRVGVTRGTLETRRDPLAIL